MRSFVKACVLSIAIASSSHAQASKTRPAPSPLSKGIALFNAEKLEPAKAAFTPLAAAGDAQAMYYLGRIAIDQSKPDSAIAWLEQAIKKNDSSSVFHQWLAGAYSVKLAGASTFAQMGLAPTFKRETVRAVELDSTNVEARVNLAQFYLQAPAMMGGGVDKARLEAAAIQRLNPYQGRLTEASIAENQKDTVAAEKMLRDIQTAYPDSSQPTVRLALFYVTGKRYDDAFKLLDARLKRTPTDGAALYQFGRVGAVSGLQLDRAQAALTRYLKTPHVRGTPTLAAAHWRLGMVLEAKGDKKTARSEYETSLRLDPNLAGAKTSLEKLK